ncbi:hypothetical protein DB31_2743 [Hyalangium minutum]|uniref:Inner spore coat protein H n=2 Tax=Hyalangium minutum TaxID=394096 RepID=A0A085W637_9BACT|nr:hypothetical protein DB31_2743 [Hyalangium minutum]
MLLAGCARIDLKEEQAPLESEAQRADALAQPFQYPPLQTSLDELRVQIDPAVLELFYEERDTPPQPIVLTLPDGRSVSAEMRLRGNSSRGWPKKSWRIDLPTGEQYKGRKKLNLLSEWREQTMMLEKLAYDMLEAMNVPVSRATYVRLVINGEYQGVYLDTDRVDKSLLSNQGFQDLDANIYRTGGKNGEMKTSFDSKYQRDWEKETNAELPNDDLVSFLQAINYTPEPNLEEMLEQRVELEHYLRVLVAEALVTMNTVEDAKSYWIHDAVTDRWTYGPWDFNNTDAKYLPEAKPGKQADYNHPLFNFSLFDGFVEAEWLKREEDEPKRWKPIFSNLNTRIFNHPQLRDRLLTLYEKGIAELLDPAVLSARIDAMHALLAPHMRGAPHVVQALFDDSPRYLKQYSANRTGFLRSEIARWRARKPQLVIQAVNAKEGWVELRNLHTSPVSTTGLVLTTDLRTAKKKNVPTKTLAPGETVRFTDKQLGLKLMEDGELGLFDGKSVVGVMDLLFYGKLPPGRYYERSREEPNPWVIH